MSWAEVKKLNSDLSTPLNLAALINHIDLVGNRYVGWDNETLTKSLILSDSLYNHQIAANIIGADSLSTQVKADSYGYIWLCRAANTPHSSFSSLEDVLLDSSTINAIVASETALSGLVTSDVALNAIAKSSSACSNFATSTSGITTVSWETDTLWNTLKATLDASDLFTKSGLITDTGDTKTNTGNVITLIQSVFTSDVETYKLGVTPAYAGCYSHAYTHRWSTGKHIMLGGHTSTHQKSDINYCYVKHYKYTAI